MKSSGSFQEGLPTRVVMLFISVLIPIHLIVLAVYIQQSRSTQHLARRNGVIQQVMNVTHMVQATPLPQLPRAVAALDQSAMKVSIDDDPKFTTRVDNLAFWIINRLVPRNAKAIRLSLHLLSGKWLNIEANILKVSLLPQMFLLLIEMLLAIIIFFYAWSLNRFIKPLKDFKKAAEGLGVDVQSARFKEYQGGPKIVRETAEAMKRMQKRIQDLLDNRNTMLAAISHDLRTPITRLKLRLSKLDNANFIQAATADLDEMDQMIGEILTFARNDHSEETKVWLELNAFLKTICDECVDMGWPVHYESDDKRVPLYVRKIALKRAICNILHNAVKYGKKAQVRLTYLYSKPAIFIDDEGPGIAQKDLDFVFAPFYRCDHSRSRKIAGTGLGLAVAREAIRANSGEIYLENRPSGGLRVKIVF